MNKGLRKTYTDRIKTSTGIKDNEVFFPPLKKKRKKTYDTTCNNVI